MFNVNLNDLSFKSNLKINKDDALIIVDMQNDFMPGGALAVDEGDEIIDGINQIAEKFRKKSATIILTQDWHPLDHMSFASNHPGKEPGDEFQTEAIGPVLWPDHCVQETKGAIFHKNLKTGFAHLIIRKGYHPEIDSYSGFMENDRKSETGLAGALESLKINRIFICGLALDYCCYFTALDGKSFGFKVIFIVDMTKGIDLPEGNISNALETMNKKGIQFTKKEFIL